MTLDYTSYQTARMATISTAADDRFPGQTAVTAGIADIITSGGEFEREAKIAFNEATQSHKDLLWLILERRFISYRRNRVGATVTQQTPVGSITTGDSLGTMVQMDEKINFAANRIDMLGGTMTTGGGLQ